MSHAVVLIALGGIEADVDLDVCQGPRELVRLSAAEEIDVLVADQMAPFDENNEMFRDGSRWDWYVVGGRWDGMLMGKNIVRRKDLNPGLFLLHSEEQHRKWYHELQERAAYSRDGLDVVWGELAHDIALSEDEFVRKHATNQMPVPYAFLRNHQWHERERLGWWGGTAYTECALKSEDKDQDVTPVCIYRHPDGAAVFSWGNTTNWDERFYARFVMNLHPDTVLVVVDYHV